MGESAPPPGPPRLPHAYALSQAPARAKYLKDWKLVRRARFNAAKRYERKQEASTLAFAIAGIVGFLVPVYTLIFREDISLHSKNVLDFSAYITGAMSLILGLIEQAREHSAKALRFDECARQVNSVLRNLNTTPTMTDQDLQPFIERYEKALEQCGDNHDDIDYEIAKAQLAVEDSSTANNADARKQLKSLRRSELFQTYWLYASIWIAPIAIGIIIGFFSTGGQTRVATNPNFPTLLLEQSAFPIAP